MEYRANGTPVGSLWVVLAALAAAVMVTWPMLAYPYLPLTDLPNHIARHYLIAQDGHGPLADYYETPLMIVPNSAADLIWRAVAGFADPISFSRWMFAFYAINFLAAVMVLSRMLHGRWTLWPLAAALLVYNGNYLWGFQNYLISAPFVIWGICLWLVTERWSLALRLAILLPFATFLYMMHLFAFAGLAIACFGREVQRLIEAPRGTLLRATGRGLLMALTFLPAIGHLLTITLAAGPGIQGNHSSLPDAASILWALRSIGFQSRQDAPAIFWSGMALLAAVWVVIVLALRRRGMRLSVDPRMRGVLVALTCAMIAAPIDLNGVGYVNIRLPFLVVAVLIAATCWIDLPRRAGHLVASIMVILLAMRVVALDRYTARHSAEIADLVAVIDLLAPGSRLLPLRAPGRQFRDPRLWHAGAYAVTLQQSYIPTLFQGVHSLVVRPEWRAISHPQLMAVSMARALLGEPTGPGFRGNRYWIDWQKHFTHILVLDDFDHTLFAGLPLREIARQGRFTLYEVIPPAP